MAIVAEKDSTLEAIKGTVAVFITLAGLTLGLTWLFLGMRSVMEIGGACAEGGPFVPVQPCPKGIPGIMLGGIWGGIIACALYVWATIRFRVPSLVLLAWPALFLSLGWNFLYFGLNPPFGGGVAWGWLVCAIVFGLMGGLPLLAVVGPILKGFSTDPPPEPPTFKTIRTSPSVVRTKLSRSPAQPKPFSDDPDLVDELERLDRLHRSGGLTAEEFEEAKRVLLRGRR